MFMFKLVMQLLEDYDAYAERFNLLYDEFVQWLRDEGFSQEQIDGLMSSLDIGEYIPSLVADATDLFEQGVLFILFLVYMLLEYNEQAEKHDVQRQVDSKIRRYIVIKIVISIFVGICVAIILVSLHVTMWMLFALLTFLLNFIPNVGCMIATILPLPVVLLDPEQEWWSIMLVFLLPATVHFFVGNFAEPVLMGKSMHISAVAVLAGLAFWGGVWGLVGAFMSVPLTVISHQWLKAVDHPIAQFLGDLTAGEFNVQNIHIGTPRTPRSYEDST
jgi:AI-2 transport protein TqsA